MPNTKDISLKVRVEMTAKEAATQLERTMAKSFNRVQKTAQNINPFSGISKSVKSATSDLLSMNNQVNQVSGNMSKLQNTNLDNASIVKQTQKIRELAEEQRRLVAERQRVMSTKNVETPEYAQQHAQYQAVENDLASLENLYRQYNTVVSAELGKVDKAEQKYIADTNKLRGTNHTSIEAIINDYKNAEVAITNRLSEINAKMQTIRSPKVMKKLRFEYKDLESQLVNVRTSMQNLTASQNTFANMRVDAKKMGFDSVGYAIRSMSFEDADKLWSKFNIRTGQDLVRIYEQLDVKANTLYKDLSKMRNAGTAFTYNTQEAEKLSTQITTVDTKLQKASTVLNTSYNKSNTNLTNMVNKLGVLKLRANEFAQSGNKSASSWAQLRNTANSTRIAILRQVEAQKEMLRTQFQQLGTGDADLQKRHEIIQEFQRLNGIVSQVETSMDGFDREEGLVLNKAQLIKAVFKDLSKIGKSMLKAPIQNFKKLTRGVTKCIKGIKNLRKASDRMSNSLQKGMKGNLVAFFKYAFGIRSLFVLFNKIRTYGTKAFKTLATQSEETNKQISSILTNFTTLQMTIATMLQPVLKYFTPAINIIIKGVTTAMTAVGEFFAVLTGQKYIYKATANNVDLADSLEKDADAAKKAADAQKELLGYYDKLNVEQQDKNKGTSSSDKDDDDLYSGVYEKAPISDAVSKFAEEVKKAWKNADFTDVGKIVGAKLKSALDSIDWTEIQTTAKNIGQSLGTLIAGFISVPGLAQSIGTAIGQSLNTFLIGIDNFVKNVPWENLGSFIATSINTMFSTKDTISGKTPMQNLANTIVNIMNGAFDLLKGFTFTFNWGNLGDQIRNSINRVLTGVDWNNAGWTLGGLVSGIATTVYNLVSTKATWSNLGTSIASGINGFFNSMSTMTSTGKTGWQNLGESISNSITGITTSIKTAFDKADWKSVGKGIGDAIGSIKWGEIVFDFASMAESVIKGIGTAIKECTKTAPLSSAIIGAIAGISILATSFASLAGTILSAIGGALVTFAGTEGGLAALGTAASSVVSAISGALMTFLTSGQALALFKLAGLGLAILQEILAALAAAFAGFALGDWIGKNLLTPDNMKKYQYTINLWDFFKFKKEDWSDFWQAFADWIVDMEDKWDDKLKDIKNWGSNIVQGMYSGITSALSTAKKWFLDNVWEPIKTAVCDAFDIHSPSKKFAEFGGYMIDGLKNGIKDGLTTIKTIVTDHILKPMKEKFDNLTDWGKDIATKILNAIKAGWATLTTTVTMTVSGVKNKAFEAVETAWNTIKKGASATLKALGSPQDSFKNVTKVFSDLAGKTKETTLSIATKFKAGAKSAIDKVTSLINKIKSKSVNLKLKIDTVIDGMKQGLNKWLVDWVNKNVVRPVNNVIKPLPGSLQIPEIKALAQGGVIPPNHEFLAMLGDQKSGVNIETPLQTMIDAFNTALDKRDGGSNNQPIVLQLNGRDIARVVYDENQKRYKQTGRIAY